MREASFSTTPTAQVRFHRAGRAGRVRAYYGITRRPAQSGFSALVGWKEEKQAGVGFPTIKCLVESARPGYWSNLGWIQWVTQEHPGRRPAVRLVDTAPAFFRTGLPFASLGYCPSFFDAPAYNSLPAVDWRASLFLCTMPMLRKSEPIVPLAGFRWGYRITPPGTKPRPYPLEMTRAVDWTSLRRELLRACPDWTFAARYSPATARFR